MGYGVECHPRLQSARSCVSSVTSMETLEVVVLLLSMADFVERNCVLMAGIIQQRNK
jgi:hypothetical protein